MKTKILSVLLMWTIVLMLFPAFTVWGDDYSITLSLPDGIDFGTFKAWSEIPEGVPCTYPCNAIGSMAPQDISATFAPATEGVKLSAEISGDGADGFFFMAFQVSPEELWMSVIFLNNGGAPGIRIATVTITATDETDGSILATESFNLSYTLEGPAERPPWPLARITHPYPFICSFECKSMNDVTVTSVTKSGTTENGFLLTVEGPVIGANDEYPSIDVLSLDVQNDAVYIELRDYNYIKTIGTIPETWNVTLEISNELLGKEIIINGVSWKFEPQTIENIEMTYDLSTLSNAVQVTLSHPLLDDTLIVAYYEGDKLMGFNANPIPQASIPGINIYSAHFTELIPQTATVKAFVWDNFDNIKPSCSAKMMAYENDDWIIAD